MKLLDANILLYAYDTSSSHHEACRVWLESAFNADETIALPWQTILAFVRISTNPRAVKHPLSSPHARTRKPRFEKNMNRHNASHRVRFSSGYRYVQLSEPSDT
jgi:predicted nucleic acid-binding protein